LDTLKGPGIIIKLEVCMAEGKRKFDRGFKIEAVCLIAEGGRSDGQEKAGPN
jgi:hypothetical protein